MLILREKIQLVMGAVSQSEILAPGPDLSPDKVPAVCSLDHARSGIVAPGIDDRLPLLRSSGVDFEDHDVTAHPVLRHKAPCREDQQKTERSRQDTDSPGCSLFHSPIPPLHPSCALRCPQSGR